MTLDLTDHEAALLLKELNGLIDGDRYFLSDRVKTLKAIRAKIRPEPERKPLPQSPKRYAPPRASAARRRRTGAENSAWFSRIRVKLYAAVPTCSGSGP